jgi:hypothetical protein
VIGLVPWLGFGLVHGIEISDREIRTRITVHFPARRIGEGMAGDATCLTSGSRHNAASAPWTDTKAGTREDLLHGSFKMAWTYFQRAEARAATLRCAPGGWWPMSSPGADALWQVLSARWLVYRSPQRRRKGAATEGGTDDHAPDLAGPQRRQKANADDGQAASGDTQRSPATSSRRARDEGGGAKPAEMADLNGSMATAPEARKHRAESGTRRSCAKNAALPRCQEGKCLV